MMAYQFVQGLRRSSLAIRSSLAALCHLLVSLAVVVIVGATGLIQPTAALIQPTAAMAAQAQAGGWSRYRDPLYGFFIAYPNNVFRPDDSGDVAGARSFVSRDGRAKLLVGAFANETGDSMAQYRAYILKQSYAGADIDYAPVRRRFFVLSGTRNGVIFYERVSFTCGGDIINSWAMVYPEEEKNFYDRVVEAVAKTYRPGSRVCQ